MTSYLLTYDLRQEADSHDYGPLIDELESLGAQKTLYSVWLIAVDNTAKELHDHFQKYLDSNDRLFVLELTKNHYYSGVISGTTKWIKDNPPYR